MNQTPFLTSRQSYEELEPYWNGALARQGAAPALSSYFGRSSLHHSASWAYAEGLKHGEATRNGPRRQRVKLSAYDRIARDALIVLKLRKGSSYKWVADELGISADTVAKVARKNGLDRSWAQGTNTKPYRAKLATARKEAGGE
jgi:hypothetical protein